MNREERIAAMEFASNALSKACDALIKAKKEFDWANTICKETTTEIALSQKREWEKFENEWKIEWKEKWGAEWEDFIADECFVIQTNPQNFRKFSEKKEELEIANIICSIIWNVADKKTHYFNGTDWKFD